MFGLMNLDTGKCWSSKGIWFIEDIEKYTYRIDTARIVAVPKDYINYYEEGRP
jgi:hypothetical protein